MELSTEEIEAFVSAAVAGGAQDYQVAAFLMATFIRGMNDRETADLTMAMAQSGETVDLADLSVVVDKHSTGGVADSTTLVVAPLVAACGAPVAKLTGRGLGHTGGTVDKLESIPGMTCSLTIEDFVAQVKRIGIGLISATKQLAPADAIFYALRDVTATVDSVPLIASSIMSKKIASGATHIVLDVKFGAGAFMKTAEQAENLARKMVEVGRLTGRPTTALLTAMDEPLGKAIGNALEVAEAVQILRGEGGSARLKEVSLALAAEMLLMHGSVKDKEQARERLEKVLTSGAAYEKFAELVSAQGGDLNRPLPKAGTVVIVCADADGYVAEIAALELGNVAMQLGAGRKTKADVIDPAAGLVLRAAVGDYVHKGDLLAELHTDRDLALDSLKALTLAAFRISDQKPSPRPLVLKTIKSVL